LPVPIIQYWHIYVGSTQADHLDVKTAGIRWDYSRANPTASTDWCISVSCTISRA